MKLTDEQIDAIWANSTPTNFEARSFARAIEAAVLAQGEPVGINGLTEAETAATASVMGFPAPSVNTALLEDIAEVAHCGGLVGMTEADALILIRKLTLPHWRKERTPEQARAAIAAAEGKV